MQRDFFHTINLEDHLEISAAIAAALSVTVQSLLGRKFYYKAAARAVYLLDNGRYRKVVELTADLVPPANDCCAPGQSSISPADLATIRRLIEGVDDYVAATPLSALRAVWVTIDGLRYASADDNNSCDAVLGITLHAATIDQAVQVHHSGPIFDENWNWTQGDPVFLGLEGLLTQDPDSALPLVELGIAMDAKRLLVRIQTPFF